MNSNEESAETHPLSDDSLSDNGQDPDENYSLFPSLLKVDFPNDDNNDEDYCCEEEDIDESEEEEDDDDEISLSAAEKEQLVQDSTEEDIRTKRKRDVTANTGVQAGQSASQRDQTSFTSSGLPSMTAQLLNVDNVDDDDDDDESYEPGQDEQCTQQDEEHERSLSHQEGEEMEEGFASFSDPDYEHDNEDADEDEDDEDDDEDEDEGGDEVLEGVDFLEVMEEDVDEDDDDDDDDDEDDDDDDAEMDYNLLFASGRAQQQLLQKFDRLTDEDITTLVHPVAHEVARDNAQGPKVAASISGHSFNRYQGRINTARMILRREHNHWGIGRFTHSQCRHVSQRFLPMGRAELVDQMQSKAYIGRFTPSGSLFVGAFQSNAIRIYNAQHQFRMVKEVQARNLRWTVTDTSMSPCERLLAYATISPVVNLCNINHSSGLRSVANVTDIHEVLDFSHSRSHQFGIWSLDFTKDGSEIAAGTGAGAAKLCVMDVNTTKLVAQVHAHADDVNAVRHACSDSNGLIFTGSDDTLVKAWDRRTLGMRATQHPVGVMPGHTEGITHIDSKGDGRYLISNSKDQSIRLWDVRKMASGVNQVRQALRENPLPHFRWDYRYMFYPGKGLKIQHPADCAVQVYRGHDVLETLIRCYFSPSHTTGQRYIYSGSQNGVVYIYDLISGKVVSELRGHHGPVRDMSWHPTEPMLVSVSWDGMILRWDSRRKILDPDE